MEITREKIIQTAREAKALALELGDRKAIRETNELLAALGDHRTTEQELEEIRQLALADAVPTALYRHFNAADELLYIGISLSVAARLSGHRNASPWYTQVTRITVDWYACRSDAILAEELAIKRERPKHNKTHNETAHAST